MPYSIPRLGLSGVPRPSARVEAVPILVPLGRAEQTGVGLGLAPLRGVDVDQAAYAELGRPVVPTGAVLIAQAAQAEDGRLLSWLRAVPLGPAQYAELANFIASGAVLPVEAAGSTEVGRVVAWAREVPLERALQGEQALALMVPKTLLLGLSEHAEEGRPVGAASGLVLGQAAQDELAQSVAFLTSVGVRRAQQTESALGIEQPELLIDDSRVLVILEPNREVVVRGGEGSLTMQ